MRILHSRSSVIFICDTTGWSRPNWQWRYYWRRLCACTILPRCM